ncbi:putative serine hydrolase [Arctopsyche grandis]|uniref:putative serine hydrolase n=1 Tax=Arctopsyche grandis TaxID=121162 RepID=UPI00406D829E
MMNSSKCTLTILNTMRKSFRNLYFINRSYSSAVTEKSTADIEFEEVEIPVPWGHISCVHWGPKDKQPILALHGWQDNAGTWKPLIPHLPKNTSILAIDFPGHGKSSWFPSGTFYHFPDNPVVLRRIVKYYGWKSVSLLGHSMGAITSFAYSALFPDEVNFMIQLDNLKPTTGRSKNFIERSSTSLDKSLIADARNISGSEPPSYSWDEITEKVYLGSHKSIGTTNAKHLMERGLTKSASDPNKYYFSRDSRLKRSFELGTNMEDVRAMAERIKCPTLHIKFESGPYFEPKEMYMEILEMMKKNKDFEAHVVPGTHHSHLNNPELSAPLINTFLQKYHKI